MQSLTERRERGGQAFLLALGVAALWILPFLCIDRGHFLYYGDFNAQQVPFYQMAHDHVRAGDIFWDWNTDLGANFIGSYSFYLLGSPFFWLTLPFPSAAVPYLMGPLLVLKLACASYTAYLFCRRFVSPELSVLGGLLYAFSGFSVYNIFFNHFHEAIVYFPLMLWALERYMAEGRRGWFALTVFLSALNNYYFFIGQAIFLVIYWVVRLASHAWEVRPSRLLGIWLEAILGTAMAGVLLLPSFYAVLQNSRTEELLSGWDLLIYKTPQRLWDIIHSFFFPQDIPARPNFFPDADNKWASMSAWLPLFGCSGVIAYLRSRRHTDWLRRMLVLCLLFAVIPVFNAMFQLMNAMYYARWYYMMVLLLALATVRCFDASDPATEAVSWRHAFFWSFAGTLFFALLIGLAPKSWEPDGETGRLSFGLMEYPDRFWVYVAIALVGLILALLLTLVYRRFSKDFYKLACVALCGVSLMYGWYFLGLGKANAYYPSQYILDRVLEGDEKVTFPDTEDWWRLDPNEEIENLCMYWQHPGIQAFHSVVPGSVMEFYNSVGVSRSVSSKPGVSHYALRALLSVRWAIDYDNADGVRYKKEDQFLEKDGSIRLFGFAYRDTQNGYRMYENENFLPMGFTYDSYITRAEYDALQEYQRELMLLKALVVEEEQVPAVSQLLPHRDTSGLTYTYSSFRRDVEERRREAATAFTPDSRGFTAEITLDEPGIVFFSVPYEGGWSAQVDGVDAELLRVNVGFMAVACPAGTSRITFRYRTPGLRTGLCITLGAAALLGLYLLLGCLRRTRRGASASVSDAASVSAKQSGNPVRPGAGEPSDGGALSPEPPAALWDATSPRGSAMPSDAAVSPGSAPSPERSASRNSAPPAERSASRDSAASSEPAVSPSPAAPPSAPRSPVSPRLQPQEPEPTDPDFPKGFDLYGYYRPQPSSPPDGSIHSTNAETEGNT